MFEILIVAALGLVLWERALFTFQTSRAEDISWFACKWGRLLIFYLKPHSIWLHMWSKIVQLIVDMLLSIIRQGEVECCRIMKLLLLPVLCNWLLHLLYTSCCFQLQFIFIIRHTMGLIMSKGRGSIPIYSGYPTNIVGLILVRNSGTRVYYQLIGLSYFLARNSHTWLKAFHISYCLLHACAEY